MYPRPQVLCYNIKLGNPREISFKSKWEPFSGLCWTHLIKLTATVSKTPQGPSSQKGDQNKSDPKPGFELRFQSFKTSVSASFSQQPISATNPQVGPELPPRLRTQYSDISSDPDIERFRIEKVKKKHKCRTSIGPANLTHGQHLPPEQWVSSNGTNKKHLYKQIKPELNIHHSNISCSKTLLIHLY